MTKGFKERLHSLIRNECQHCRRPVWVDEVVCPECINNKEKGK